MELATWDHSEEWNSGLTLRDRILHNVHLEIDGILRRHAILNGIGSGPFPEDELWTTEMCLVLTTIVDSLEEDAENWAQLLDPREDD